MTTALSDKTAPSGGGFVPPLLNVLPGNLLPGSHSGEVGIRAVGYGPTVMYSTAMWRAELRRRVLRELRETGFRRRNGLVVAEDLTKDGVRKLHARQRAALLESERSFIETREDDLLRRFANGSDVEPDLIFPEVVPVSSQDEADLFKYATLLWSVPVSQGYGRRSRFLVMDRQTEALIGVFALGDPVFNLTARDRVVGWSADQRRARLYNVLDAFVLGAVPPYRQLIGGKLVALAAVSDRTLDFITQKYQGTTTHIQQETKNARPVLVTTTSALGRSSLYNRLKYRDHLVFESAGFTRGYGHFHISESLFRELIEFLARDDGVPGHDYGQGPNWRMRALREAFSKLGLKPEILRHGVKREVFLAPVARNWIAYLRGDTDEPNWYHFDLDGIADFFARRWAYPRAQRDPSYQEFRPDDLRLSRQLEEVSHA
jgi:hypothetical protein